MEYLTVNQTAEKWDVSARWVHKLLLDGRVKGSKRFGSTWMIPADAEKPADARIKSGSYIGKFRNRKKSANKEQESNEQ